MSISNELQRMMSSNERGAFLTEDKKLEFKALNEGIFSNIGADIASISNTLTKKMKSIASKTGKALEHSINKLDIAGFKKSMGVKDIDDIDEKLSLMAVNDPEFYALMNRLMTTTIKAKKTNKELYDALTPIYDSHMDRMIDYYETLLQHSTDDTQSEMYYLLLHDIISWLDKDRNKTLISKIRTVSSMFLDKKALRPYVKKSHITTASDKRVTDAMRKIEDKVNKMAQDFDKSDVQKLSPQDKDVYRQYMQIMQKQMDDEGMSAEEAVKAMKKKAEQPAAPAAPASPQETKKIADTIQKKLGKSLVKINEADLQKLSTEEREAYIQQADKFLEDFETGNVQSQINPATGLLNADLGAVEAQLNVAKTLAAAIKMRGKTFASKNTPDKTPVKQPPAAKPGEPVKPNPVTASKKSNEPVAPATPAKPNPITAGKKL